MRRLLVIEDDPDSLLMFSRLLELGGYEVTSCGHIGEAIRALEIQTFDLVLADLLLSTAEVERAWRTMATFVELARPAPLGVMTGWIVDPDDAKRRGIDFVIRKPFTRDELFSQLASSLHLPPISGDREAMLREYFGHLERSRYGALAWLCTEDVVYRVPGSDPRFSNEVRGRAELVDFATKTFEAFPRPTFDIQSIRPLPSGAIVEYIGSWREGDDTRQMPGAVMFELRDERISRINVRLKTEDLR